MTIGEKEILELSEDISEAREKKANLKGQKEASHIYASKTAPALKEVQTLLRKLRDEHTKVEYSVEIPQERK